MMMGFYFVDPAVLALDILLRACRAHPLVCPFVELVFLPSFYQIGLMRSGHLLAEESPHNLLSVHNLTSLEDVFLKLCMKDMNRTNRNGEEVSAATSTAPVVAVTNGSAGGKNYPAIPGQGGHDNPAFAQSFNNPDAVTADVDHGEDHQPTDPDDDHKNLAQLSIVSFFFLLR